MNKKIIWLIIGLLLVSSVACTSLFSLSKLTSEKSDPTPVVLPTTFPTSTTSPVESQNSQQAEDLLVQVYNQTSPGVVSIQTLTEQGSALGSGFVYDKEGHIITNYHVVQDASELEVDFPAGYKVRGTVIGFDLDSDIAVIKVDASPDILVPLPLGDSEATQVGQTVVAIGNPFGLGGTMTVGIVSAKGRTLSSLRTSPDGGYFSAGDIIQTDASINPGNSGGPLLNLKGEVIGINRAIRTTGTTLTGDPVNSGVGFAISSNIVSRVVPSLISSGSYDYPYLGIVAREELSLMEQEALGITDESGNYIAGAYVLEVVDGSPAAQAGLIGATKENTGISGLPSGGDLITAVDGKQVQVFGDLLSYLMTNKSPDDLITLTIVRDQKIKEVTITLGKRP